MKIKVAYLLPIAFLLHNAEELYAIAVGCSPVDLPYGTGQFAIAVVLFSVMGFILVFTKGIYRNDKQYCYALNGLAGMLFLNSFFPHIILSLATLSYTPGLVTAVIMLIPLSFVFLRENLKSGAISRKGLVWSVILGGAVGAALIPLFLAVGALLINLLL